MVLCHLGLWNVEAGGAGSHYLLEFISSLMLARIPDPDSKSSLPARPNSPPIPCLHWACQACASQRGAQGGLFLRHSLFCSLELDRDFLDRRPRELRRELNSTVETRFSSA